MMVVAPESVIGLPREVAFGLLEPITAGTSDQERTLAWIIWSHLTEPGDMLAGALLQAIGPVAAIRVLRLQHPAREITKLLSGLAENAGDESQRDVAALESEYAEACKRWSARDNNMAVVRSLKIWATLGGQIVTPDDVDWPRALEALGAGTPHVLWLRGNRASLAELENAIAIVGSRNVSSYGQYCAQTLAERLVAEGYLVVSGGAYGVDAEAHRGALSARGVTIAVLAGGADRLYPAGNSELLRQVMHGGCLLAEQPPGHAPTRWRFLQRNRLIAALGQATVVVEMAVKSGAKNTMHHALGMGREVYAVPGSLLAQTARGCNVAIAEGKAKIVTAFDELINDLRDIPYSLGTEFELTALQQRVLDALHGQPITVNRAGLKAGTTASETMRALGELQALGFAIESRGGWRKELSGSA